MPIRTKFFLSGSKVNSLSELLLKLSIHKTNPSSLFRHVYTHTGVVLFYSLTLGIYIYIYMPDVPRYRVKTCLVFMNNEPPLLRAVEIDFISRTAGKDVQSRAQKPFVGIRLSSWRVPSQRKDYVDTAFGVSGGQTCRETFGQTRTISCFAISTRTQR